MINVSGFGTVMRVTASSTFPNGFTVTAFPDDADPLDAPDIVAADSAYGTNGDMIVWSRPSVNEISANVLPGTQDDVNLTTLLNANIIGKGLSGAQDTISVAISYPTGVNVIGTKGAILSGTMIPTFSSNGRIKTKHFVFRFESITISGNVSQEV